MVDLVGIIPQHSGLCLDQAAWALAKAVSSCPIRHVCVLWRCHMPESAPHYAHRRPGECLHEDRLCSIPRSGGSDLANASASTCAHLWRRAEY